VKLPFLNPTKLGFRGDGMDTIYITTMSERVQGRGEPGCDGGLFAFKPGVTGAPAPNFAN